MLPTQPGVVGAGHWAELLLRIYLKTILGGGGGMGVVRKSWKQAGAELGQAKLQLELGFTLIKVCCIILMITNYHYISLSTISL